MTWAGVGPGIPWGGLPELNSRVRERWGPYRIQPLDLPLSTSFITLWFPSLAAWVECLIDPEGSPTNNGVYRIGDRSTEVTPLPANLRHSFSIRYQTDFPQRYPGPWKSVTIGRGGTAPTSSLIIWAGLTDLDIGLAGQVDAYAGSSFALYRNDGNDPA